LREGFDGQRNAWAAKVFQAFAVVIRVFDEVSNVIETREHTSEFKEP
jgi:hypothetical protein